MNELVVARIQNICREIMRETESPSCDVNLIATMLAGIAKIIDDEKKQLEESHETVPTA